MQSPEEWGGIPTKTEVVERKVFTLPDGQTTESEVKAREAWIVSLLSGSDGFSNHAEWPDICGDVACNLVHNWRELSLVVGASVAAPKTGTCISAVAIRAVAFENDGSQRIKPKGYTAGTRCCVVYADEKGQEYRLSDNYESHSTAKVAATLFAERLNVPNLGLHG